MLLGAADFVSGDEARTSGYGGLRAAAFLVRSNDRSWLQADGQARLIDVGLTPSSRHSGSSVARHANLATNAPDVRFLPIPSAVQLRAEAPGVIVGGRL